MFINRFYLKERDYEKNNANTIHSSRIRFHNYVLYFFDKPKSDRKYSDNSCSSIYDRIGFFIQQHITYGEEIQKKRQKHFEILKTSILEPWVRELASLSNMREGSTYSFIDLYVNIFDKLRSNNRFQRILSHLDNEDYKEITDLLSKIESRSKTHNQKVSDYMHRFEGQIFGKVFMKNISDGIVNDFTEYRDPKSDHGYSLKNIKDHYAKEASGNHSELTIDEEKQAGKTKFQIHRSDAGANVAILAISTDENQLGSIRKKLEDDEVKSAIVKPLEGFLKEGNEIVELYNGKLIPEIQNIITEIEDEGEMKGGCGLTYCKK
jgi:hypothetical protein